MLPNGFLAVLEAATASAPLPPERHAALVLGVLREDVWVIGPYATPSPSLGHHWPLSPRRCARLVARAGRARGLARYVWLGRALHVLVDMACPPHARARPHSPTNDPFERFVEAHAAELAGLPVPEVAPAAPAVLVSSLARAARAAAARPIAEQARLLVPLAAGHVRAFLASVA